MCLSFNLRSTQVATGSMDTTARLWDIQSGQEVNVLSVGKFSLKKLAFIVDFIKRDIQLKLSVCNLIQLALIL